MNLSLEVPTVDVCVGGVSVSLRPLPLGFHRRLKERGVVPPVPKRTAARDSAGRVLRDADGRPVLTEDAADAGHLAAVDRYQERLAALMLAESLGGGVSFETPPPGEAGDWNAYADRLLEELSEAGVTPGDLATLCRGVCEASRLIEPAVKAAGERLFPAAAEAATG